MRGCKARKSLSLYPQRPQQLLVKPCSGGTSLQGPTASQTRLFQGLPRLCPGRSPYSYGDAKTPRLLSGSPEPPLSVPCRGGRAAGTGEGGEAQPRVPPSSPRPPPRFQGPPPPPRCPPSPRGHLGPAETKARPGLQRSLRRCALPLPRGKSPWGAVGGPPRPPGLAFISTAPPAAPQEPSSGCTPWRCPETGQWDSESLPNPSFCQIWGSCLAQGGQHRALMERLGLPPGGNEDGSGRGTPQQQVEDKISAGPLCLGMVFG